MTDNDIIKAYGCCNLSHDECGGCDNCPCKIEGECIVPSGFELEREVFNLLNRQQAEIEKLKEASEEAVSCFHRMESLYNIKRMELKVAKTEAVKELAKRLKKSSSSKKHKLFVAKVDIDSLAKKWQVRVDESSFNVNSAEMV